MQIRIRSPYIATDETIQRATHAFAIYVKRIRLEQSNVLKLRPPQRLTNGEHAREPLLMAPKSGCNRYGRYILQMSDFQVKNDAQDRRHMHFYALRYANTMA